MNEYYNEGYSAFTEGMDFSDNPYPSGSTRSEEWASGWVDAQGESGESFGGEEDLEDLYADWI